MIADYAAAGLPIPSKIRTEKIATLETARTTRIGRLPGAELALVADRLALSLQQIRA